MKISKLFHVLATLCFFAFQSVGNCQDEFAIGVNMASWFKTGTVNGCANTYLNYPLTAQSNPTSFMNQVSNDGFNMWTAYMPHEYNSLEDIRSALILSGQYNMKMLVDGYQFYVDMTGLESPNNSYGYNTFDLCGNNLVGCERSNLYSKRLINYDQFFTSLFSDPVLKKSIYGFKISEESSYFHYHPYLDCNGGSSNQWFNNEVPPENISMAYSYFKDKCNFYNFPDNVKIVIGEAHHGKSIHAGSVDYQGIFNPQDYLIGIAASQEVNGQVDPRASFAEFGYYGLNTTNFLNGGTFAGLNTADGKHFLGNFESLNFSKTLLNHNLDVITMEFGESYQALYFGQDPHLLECQNHFHSDPNKENANWLWFKAYNSIVHRTNGLLFSNASYYKTCELADLVKKHLNLSDTDLMDLFFLKYPCLTGASKSSVKDALERGCQAIWPNIAVEKTFTDWCNGAVQITIPAIPVDRCDGEVSSLYRMYLVLLEELVNAQDDRYTLKWFPEYYRNYTRFLGKEISYLNNNGFLNENSIVYDKFNQSDQYCIVPPFQNYLPYGSDYHSEDYSLRYTLRSNHENELILIITNPSPLSFDVDLNFAGIGLDDIQKSKGVNVLFENTQSSPSSFGYKTDRSVGFASGEPTSYFLPFTQDHGLNVEFGPFDVKIFSFETDESTSQAIANDPRWKELWNSGNNGSLGNIPIASDSKFYPGDFDGDGYDEILVQSSFANNSLVGFDVANLNWFTLSPNTMYFGSKILIGDFDGNGADDVLDWSSNTLKLYSYINNSFSQIFFLPSSNPISSLLDYAVAGNFNFDSKTEILCSDLPNGHMGLFQYDGGNFIQLWNSNTSIPSNSVICNSAWLLDWNNSIVPLDYNGDGKDELHCVGTTYSTGGGWSANASYHWDYINQCDRWHWEWSDYGSNTIGGWTIPLINDDYIIKGDIDGTDTKDELIFFKNGPSASYAASMDFTNNTWNSNWWTSQGRLNSWPLGGSNIFSPNADYTSFTPLNGNREIILATRFHGCDGKTLASIYSTKSFNMKKDIENTEQVEYRAIVFPNPSTGLCTIELESTYEGAIEIYNYLGQNVYSIQSIKGTHFELDLTNLSSGVYTVILPQGELSQKVIKL